MGVSTDALLLYGVPISEDFGEEFNEVEEDDLDEVAEGDLLTLNKKLAHLIYYGGTENGISIVTHCSGDFPMYFVALESAITIASRGYPKNINIATLNDSSDKDKILEFINKYNIKTDGAIGWWLASYWGQ